MKILLLGSNGQVGWELQRSLAPLGQLEMHDKQTADLSDLTQLRILIQQVQPDVIVNAAAYTAVDQAEAEVAAAHQINAAAVKVMAEEAKKANVCLLHYSTDYVFDGSKSSFYNESDEPNPLSVYGQSKLAGEQAIINSHCHHFILRTSWVYAARGSNFAKTMLRLAQERDELKVVADQIGAPTSAELIADITALLVFQIKNNQGFVQKNTGIYNLVAAGEASWFDFARYVIERAKALGMDFKVGPENIVPIKTEEFPRPAKRPMNSKMATTKLAGLLNIEFPLWTYHVNRMVTEYVEQNQDAA